MIRKVEKARGNRFPCRLKQSSSDLFIGKGTVLFIATAPADQESLLPDFFAACC
jgi:hypothetical protein